MDRTGHYAHVFFACTVVVVSAAVFIIVSFSLLDRRSARRAEEAGSPGSTGAHAAPGCLYKSVPTEGDKDKTAPPAAEGVA